MSRPSKTGPGAVPTLLLTAVAGIAGMAPGAADAQRTFKPPLHGQHWMAITGKPLGATAGAMIFQQGGNAVDAACAMIAATATMWDVLSWGGETQALIYNPHTGKVIGINALGVAPSGATPEFYQGKGLRYPPQYGPLAAVTPGTPGGIMVMLAEYGKLSLAEVLAPAITLADGYPIEQETVSSIERNKAELKKWPDSTRVMLPHLGDAHEAPRAGEIFRQPELAATLRKLVDAERQALAAGKDRKSAILAALDRFYRGDIAAEIVRAHRAAGGLFTAEDLANWTVQIEEPVHTQYKGIDVYKLTVWTQGPVMLQALNILENFDLKAMGYNSARYIHTLYQAMNLAFADRDFYYGDTYFPPVEPVKGLLSKEYARERSRLIGFERNDADAAPGDPYPFQGETNPFERERAAWASTARLSGNRRPRTGLPAGDGHYQRGGGGSRGLGRIGHAERWLDPGLHRRQHRHRAVAAHAELRHRPGGESLQRGGARQAPTRHAHPDARDEGRQAVAGVRRPGRRRSGPEPAADVPQHGRIRHDRAAGRRSGQHLQLSVAGFLRPARDPARPAGRQRSHAAVGPGGTTRHGLQGRHALADVRPAERHLVRPRARHPVGRLEPPRRGLRYRLVGQSLLRPRRPML